MAYSLMKRIIERDKKAGVTDWTATKDKLDTFYAADRLTKEQYNELLALIGAEAE
mgnify:CR=1 FL=1